MITPTYWTSRSGRIRFNIGLVSAYKYYPAYLSVGLAHEAYIEVYVSGGPIIVPSLEGADNLFTLLKETLQ